MAIHVTDIVQVVVEYRKYEDGEESVVLVGVFGEDEEIPPPEPGCIRNTVKTFFNVMSGGKGGMPVFTTAS